MRSTTIYAATSLVALSWLFAACSDKKSFSGGSKISPSQAANVEPAPAPAPAPTPDPEPSIDVPDPITVSDDKVFKECDANGNNGVIGSLYRLDQGTNQLPDFAKLTPIKQVCLPQIDIHDREFDEGFPGVDDLKEWFGIDFTFNLKVDVAGDYKIKIVSDDGSKIFVDGNLLFSNDGLHSAKSKDERITLSAGLHKINLPYYQGPANRIALELFWTPPGGSEVIIPAKNLIRIK